MHAVFGVPQSVSFQHPDCPQSLAAGPFGLPFSLRASRRRTRPPLLPSASLIFDLTLFFSSLGRTEKIVSLFSFPDFLVGCDFVFVVRSR